MTAIHGAPFPAGVRRGLDACASRAGRFTVLALDHRQNLRREIDPDDPDGVPYQAMVELKRAVVRVLGPVATGVLLDPEIGAAQSIADGSLAGGTGLIVAIEATGYDGRATARRSRVLDGWSVRKARRMGASAAKLLVYYHPEAANAREQEALVGRVAEECRAQDLPLFVEPLTYPIDPGVEMLTGEDRRSAVVETARRLSAVGGDVLKVEFPYDDSVREPARWQDACAELDAACRTPWVLLSGGVDDVVFELQVETACRAGASGVLAGRSVWAEAARLEGDDRTRFLREDGVARLARLVELVERFGRPWTDRLPELAHAEPPEDWYRSYGEP